MIRNRLKMKYQKFVMSHIYVLENQLIFMNLNLDLRQQFHFQTWFCFPYFPLDLEVTSRRTSTESHQSMRHGIHQIRQSLNQYRNQIVMVLAVNLFLQQFSFFPRFSMIFPIGPVFNRMVSKRQSLSCAVWTHQM